MWTLLVRDIDCGVVNVRSAKVIAYETSVPENHRQAYVWGLTVGVYANVSRLPIFEEFEELDEVNKIMYVSFGAFQLVVFFFINIFSLSSYQYATRFILS